MTSNVLPLHFSPSQASSSQNSNDDNFQQDCHNPLKIPFKFLRTLLCIKTQTLFSLLNLPEFTVGKKKLNFLDGEVGVIGDRPGLCSQNCSMDFLSISCIDLLAKAFVIAMADSRAFSSDALIGQLISECLFFVSQIFQKNNKNLAIFLESKKWSNQQSKRTFL